MLRGGGGRVQEASTLHTEQNATGKFHLLSYLSEVINASGKIASVYICLLYSIATDCVLAVISMAVDGSISLTISRNI